MPPYQWISTGAGYHKEDTEAEDTKLIEGIKDAWPHLKRGEGRRYTGLPIEVTRQEEHVSNVDRWDISPETVRGRRKRRISTSSTTTTMTSQSIFHQPPSPEITCPR